MLPRYKNIILKRITRIFLEQIKQIKQWFLNNQSSQSVSTALMNSLGTRVLTQKSTIPCQFPIECDSWMILFHQGNQFEEYRTHSIHAGDS